ncbi:permease [Corynebacterium mendelii]|uniref:Permease n=1 Tax=Corynebacterium mendelii TaxID=2765362 RepID=A0A939E4F1_9CORY|nr:permease [Corynebacterium mendelii]MBN9645212.1 permease [Corynebacterium mendelii]
MTVTQPLSPPTAPAAEADTGHGKKIMLALAAAGIALVVYTQFATGPGSWDNPVAPLPAKVNSWAAITIAVAIQSLPFLVLGVVVSAVISAFLPVGLLQRITPTNQFTSVPVAATAAIGLPGCECASVPVAASFMRAGVPKAAALVFMLASPAVNPVVIVSTAVAFYALPEMVWARFTASFLAVLLAGWLWVAAGWDHLVDEQSSCRDTCCGAGENNTSLTRRERWHMFQDTAIEDLTRAGGFLVLGAMIAGLIKVVVPVTWFIRLASTPLAAIAVMALFAIVLSLCSEADAFVAASFTAVSPTAQLAFLVVGPMVDIKLVAMQSGHFGWRFVTRFVPLVLVCALGAAAVVGFLFFGRL